MNDRTCAIFETILIAVGVLACLLYWWHDGQLLTPSYILFGMAAMAGFVGVGSRFTRRAPVFSEVWTAIAMVVSALCILAAILAVINQLVLATYFVLVAYGSMLGVTEISRAEVRRKSRKAEAAR